MVTGNRKIVNVLMRCIVLYHILKLSIVGMDSVGELIVIIPVTPKYKMC
jgi:hypothetical protein